MADAGRSRTSPRVCRNCKRVGVNWFRDIGGVWLCASSSACGRRQEQQQAASQGCGVLLHGGHETLEPACGACAHVSADARPPLIAPKHTRDASRSTVALEDATDDASRQTC